MYTDDDENMKRIRCALDEFPLAHTLVRCARTQRSGELKFAPRSIHPHNSVPSLPHNITEIFLFSLQFHDQSRPRSARRAAQVDLFMMKACGTFGEHLKGMIE